MPKGLRFVCPSDTSSLFRERLVTGRQPHTKQHGTAHFRETCGHQETTRATKDAARALALVGRKELQQRHGQGTNFVPSRCCVCFSAKLVSLCCFDSPHAFREDSTKYAPTPKNLIVEKIAKAAE